MKKSLLALVFLCVHVFVYAQEKQSKVSLSVFAAPTVAYRTFSAESSYPAFMADLWKDIEAPKAGYSMGFLVGYSVHKKIKLQSGFSFSNNGYREKEMVSHGYTLEYATSQKTVYQYHYFDIPVQVKYTFLKKGKISFYALAGAEANFNLVNNRTKIFKFDNGEKERTTNSDEFFPSKEFQKYNCSVTGAVGVNFAASNKVDIFVQPTYRQMLLPTVMDVPVERRLYSVGLATGVSVNL